MPVGPVTPRQTRVTEGVATRSLPFLWHISPVLSVS